MNSHHPNVLLRTIDSICETICQAQTASLDLVGEPSCEKLGGFVLSWVNAMPRALSFGMKVLTLLFAVSGLLYGGRPFHRNRAMARRTQWRSWRVHRLSYLRDFVRFYEVLTMLALYSATERAPAVEARAVELASFECR
jgi:hypothetical protein